jgi:hypothetical protein
VLTLVTRNSEGHLAYRSNQAEFVTLFVRGSDGQWSVGVARFKRVR